MSGGPPTELAPHRHVIRVSTIGQQIADKVAKLSLSFGHHSDGCTNLQSLFSQLSKIVLKSGPDLLVHPGVVC